MIITWHGQTCFKIVSQKSKEGPTTTLIDLFDKEIGIKPPKNDADILMLTSSGEEPEESSAFVVNSPGEYDIKGIAISGISSGGKNGPTKNIIYTFISEDIKVCHLGKLSQAELSTEQLEEIGETDILMIPIGGGDSLETKVALKIVEQIEPKIVIPMYFKIAGLKEKLEDVSEFLKSLGIKSLPGIDKLSIKKKDLSEEEAKIIVLNP